MKGGLTYIEGYLRTTVQTIWEYVREIRPVKCLRFTQIFQLR